MLIHALLINLCISSVYPHSWLECADYQADFDGQNYNFDNCKGFPRNYKDSGANDDFASSGNQLGRIPAITSDNNYGQNVSCSTLIESPLSSMYNNEFPYATYVPGGTYRLVWPAKNHAIGEECGETQSTDKAIGVFVNPNVNPTSDLINLDEYTLIYDWHQEYLDSIGSDSTEEWGTKGVEGVPFANCEDYCADTNASPCWGDIIIPNDDNIFSQSGFYTFIWYWEFTDNVFVSCFEVYVDVEGTEETADVDASTTTTTSSPVTRTTGQTETETTDELSNTAITGDSGGDIAEENVVFTVMFVFSIPLCVTEVEYNENSLINGLETLFSASKYETNVYEIVSLSESEYLDGFNATIDIYTLHPANVGANLHNGSICNAIENGFDSSAAACEVCGEYVIRTEMETIELNTNTNENSDTMDSGDNSDTGNSNSSKENSSIFGTDDDLTVWLVIAACTAIIVFLIGGAIYCFVCNNNSNENKENKNTSTSNGGNTEKKPLSPRLKLGNNNKEMNEFALANVINSRHNTNKTQAITTVNENYNINEEEAGNATNTVNVYNAPPTRKPAPPSRRQPPRAPPRPPTRT